MHFPTTTTSQVLPPLASDWNPYWGLSPSYNIPLGGFFVMTSNPIVGGGYPPYTHVIQGFPYSSVTCTSNPW